MESKQLTALLVDDEKTNLKVLSELLKDKLNISLALSGQQAIDRAIKLAPDLILLDVVMPDMDGFETINKLKSNKETEDIPVIFITGLNSSDKEEQGLTLGAVDYIYKPFNSEVVKARVATQTKIITQRKKLEQLSHELAQASEVKSRFLANMSHEIRTPLTSVIGYAESILAGEIPVDEQHHAIEIINNSGQHLLSLINDILDLSKIEADKLDIEALPVSLFLLMKEIRSLVEHKAKFKGLDFYIDYQFPLPKIIISDPTRLKQILINLVGNAIKFTEEGFVNIVVSSKNDELIFAVNDSGIGINDKNINKLFLAFEQVGASITRQFGGTGLGLNISKYLTEKLQGYIAVESQEGKGSSFIATISLVQPDKAIWLNSLEEVTDILALPNTPKSMKGNLSGRVLLAEDDPMLQQLISSLLKNLGLNVTVVENGHRLVETALIEEFDLIISDINMPLMGGVEAVDILKKANCDARFIALTANAMTYEIDSFITAGFDAHLAKPIDRDKFYHVVSDLLHIESTTEHVKVADNVMEELQNKFIQSLPTIIKEFEVAYKNKDWKQLQFISHRLNGSSSIFNFMALSETASEIELGLKNDEFPSAEKALSTVMDNLFKIINELLEK